MIRLLFFFVVLAVLAYGGMLLVQNPGHITMDWFGYEIRTSAALLVAAVAAVAIAAWIVFRVVVGLPSFVRLAARQRRREKGYAALTRGLVAIGAGDARGATRASAQASRHLGDDALALVLQAQSAHLDHDSGSAIRAFERLARRDDTRLLGLRGLYAEANRRGDAEAAHQFASAAYRSAALPWSAQAVLEQRARAEDWEQALATVEQSVSAGLVDKTTGERQRAVLETAIAADKEGRAPEEALVLARSAMRRAPDLAPAVVLAARLLTRRGDIRKAVKLIEKAWPRCRHPDVAQAYLDVRPGDSTTDRLARAKTLMGIAAFDHVSRITVARAALANTDHAAARAALAPLVGEGQRPTVRMCLLMAEIEEAEHGDIGQWREWLARASRAALDPAWVADGIVYDAWAPVSPTTGKLDAFQWQVPAERLGPVMEALPARREPRYAVEGTPVTARLSHEGSGRVPTQPDVSATDLAELEAGPDVAPAQNAPGPVAAAPAADGAVLPVEPVIPPPDLTNGSMLPGTMPPGTVPSGTMPSDDMPAEPVDDGAASAVADAASAPSRRSRGNFSG